MSTADHAKNLAALLKRLKARYEPAPPPKRSPMDELLFGLLLWEATTPKAEAALKRLRDAHVDDNDMRVTRPHEIAASLGKLYPKAEERSARLHAVLSDIYKREHNVTLTPVMAMSKRDAAKYIETLSGLPLFASARWQLLVHESHHMPVDDRMFSRLLAAGVVEEGDDVEKAAGVLQRHVKHEDALQAHLLLQAWSEDPDSEPSATPSKSASKPAAKTAPKKKAPAKKPVGAKH